MLVVVAGVYLIAEGNLTMGALVAVTILTGRALAPLGAIAGMLTRLQQSRVALKALDELTHEDLLGDRLFLIFPTQCSNLIRKIQSKIVTYGKS